MGLPTQIYFVHLLFLLSLLTEFSVCCIIVWARVVSVIKTYVYRQLSVVAMAVECD